MSKLNMKPHRKNYKFKISVWPSNIIFKQKFIEALQRKRFGSGFSTADYQGYAVEIRTLLEWWIHNVTPEKIKKITFTKWIWGWGKSRQLHNYFWCMEIESYQNYSNLSKSRKGASSSKIERDTLKD